MNAAAAKKKYKKNPEAERLLAVAIALQCAFWDTLSELEGELGIEIDSTRELEGYTVETLLEEESHVL